MTTFSMQSVQLPATAALHFVTKKDLANVAQEFGISRKEIFIQNDADSVAAWIAGTKAQAATKNLVRFVKFQGEPSPYNLPTEDFMLIIASDAQLLGAKQFCGPMHEVCMDSTHGLNSYDFQLTTLMCIDEHGEGFPIAFCYSNHVNENAMTVFLSVIREALGQSLVDVVLMTDDTEVYVNAWTAVMGRPAYRLLCVWHVDRAWRKNLSRVKGDNALKATVYKTIRALMETADTDSFSDKLAEFLFAVHEDDRTSDFAQYFEGEYGTRTELWAYCHRLGLHVHHNMHLEAMHRVLKHVQLHGRKVRRLDKSVHALIRFLNEKMSDRLLKLHKGKWTRHLGGIRKRHCNSRAVTADMCSCLEDDTLYTVTGKETVYTVRQAVSLPHQSDTCPLVCTECDICVHAFSCTCKDSALRSTICKHVHAVVRLYKPRCIRQPCTASLAAASPLCTDRPDDGHTHEVVADVSVPDIGGEEERVCQFTENLPDVSESQAILQHFARDTVGKNIDFYVGKVETVWSSVRCDIASDIELAKVALEHMTKLSSIITALKSKGTNDRLPQLPETREPVNKKIAPQRYFRTTRKSKKQRRHTSISKPTKEEKDFLLKSLSGNTEVVSHQPPMDHDYNADTVTHVINFEHAYTAL